MDQRTGSLQQHIAETRHDIEETRASMTEKLELLEERVRGTLEETKTAVDGIVENVKGTVEETVGAVKETVDGAKSTVEGVVQNVKDVMDDTVTKAKQSFDLRYQVEQHPWLMVGGAVVAGSLLASLVHHGSETAPYSYYAHSRQKGDRTVDTANGTGLYTVAEGKNVTESQKNTDATHATPQRAWAIPRGQFQGEFDIVKNAIMGAVVSAVIGTVQEMIRQNLPGVAEHLNTAAHRIAKK